MKTLGVILLIVGCVTALIGLAFVFLPKMPWMGNLPGDIHYRGKNSEFHFPIVTCIIVSILLTVVLNVILRLFKR